MLSVDIAHLKRLYRLWGRVYPYLVAQIMGEYRRNSGLVLELGPFSGGISLELARLYPQLKITIADESSEMVAHLQNEAVTSGLAEVITVERTHLNQLSFPDSWFDLIIFRGVFFFLNQKVDLLREIFRVLKEDGMAFVGGGYGRGVPPEIIAEIADESRLLNEKLGRRRVSIGELQVLLKKAGLADKSKIEEEGGVWLIIRK